MNNSSNTILVLGAIEAFCDIVYDIEKMGYDALCCDFYEHAAAKNIAKYSYLVSTTDTDAILEIAKKHAVCGVITAFSDRNLQSALQICNMLDLPTFYNDEIINILTNKIKMKNHFTQNNFSVIPYKIINRNFDDSELLSLNFPVIIKPVDGYGSKGIVKCNDIKEVRMNLENCIKSSKDFDNTILVEEFYEADEISISGWVKCGTFYLTSTYDVGRNFEDTVVLSYVCFPSKYENQYRNKFIEIIQEITDSLNITEGPVTVQCFIGPKGLMISEYLYRLAGGSPYLYSVALDGPNTARMLIDYQLGNNIDYQNLEEYQSKETGSFYDILVFATKSGKIHYDFTRDELLAKKNIKEVLVYHNNNEILYDVSSKGCMVMRIFYHRDTDDDRKYTEVLDELKSYIVIRDDKGDNITNFRYPTKDINERIWEF